MGKRLSFKQAVVLPVVVALMLVLLGYSPAAAEEECYIDCIMRCPRGRRAMVGRAMCINACGSKCGGEPVAINSNCNNGCQVDLCSKFHNDEEKMAACVDFCFSKVCKESAETTKEELVDISYDMHV